MSLRFIKVSNPQPVVDFLISTIEEHLKNGEKVLWLLSGGSSIDLEIEVSQRLRSVDTSRLTSGLIDERYGPQGHKDSNWRQLMDAGFGLRLQPVLVGESAGKTLASFDKFISHSFKIMDFKLGSLGIGQDNHIAGVKPMSPAIKAPGMTFEYRWDDYYRITTTFKALTLLDCAVTFLAGKTKAKVLESLQKNAPLAEEPAQILKRIKQAIIFSNVTGKTR